MPALVSAITPELEAQARSLLRTEFATIVLAAVICVFALSALAGYLLRPASGDRLLLWFGLFAGVFGARLMGKSETFQALFGAAPRLWEYVAASLNYLIVIPALLFGQTLYGKGWKSLFQVFTWLMAAYGPFAIALGVLLAEPFAAPDPGTILLIVLPSLFILDYIAGYRPPPISEGWALAIGTTVFMISVLNEHLVNANLLPWSERVEPYGFFVFICCLGYVAARRFFATEQRLAAIEQEMETARSIQSSILPREMPVVRGLDVAVRYVPMAAVAGDFYDFLQRDDTHLGVLVADVSGHGVPAALVASMIKMASAAKAAEAFDPARVVDGLNKVLCKELQHQFVTAGCLFLDMEDRIALYSGAGHPPLFLWRRSSRTLHEIEKNGLLLGFRSSESYSSTQFDLHPGDRMVMCTDGIMEAEHSSRGFFGDARFRELIAGGDHLSAKDFADSILNDVSDWSGRQSGRGQEDDITLVVLDIAETPPEDTSKPPALRGA
jgi:sigma-B regulation protein RsbU (phosphoserine phosphatase)